MDEYNGILRKIRTLASITAVINAICIPIFAALAIENATYIVYSYQAAISLYIMIQIATASSEMVSNHLFSITVVGYLKKISYACFVNGIGSSVLDTLITSTTKGKVSIVLHLTAIGVGFLLYVGSYTYEYGCELEEEYHHTV